MTETLLDELPVSDVHVFPVEQQLPDNLLRFHAFFDQPAYAVDVEEAVRLFNEQGREVPHAFLDLRDGLWDPSGQRLTLLLHPARIKSGLAVHEALGPALLAGSRYRLALDLGMLVDGTSAGLRVASFSFLATPSLRTALDPASWRYEIPAAGSKEALVVRFDRPMDMLSLQDHVVFLAANGALVQTQMRFNQEPHSAAFVPLERWPGRPVQLRWREGLEDVAGNRVGAAFERKRTAIPS